MRVDGMAITDTATLMPTGLQPGNSLVLLPGGEALFAALVEAMDAAQVSIHLETYIFDFQGAPLAVAEAMERAARRGTEVRLVVDGVGTGPPPPAWQERFDAALGYQQELSDKKEEEYRNVMRSRLMTKDAENKKNVEIIRDDQKKAMQRAVHENNAKLAQMTNYYEDKLSRLEVDLGREMNRQANEIKRENERKKIDTELKIHGIVQRYESIIDKLKDDLSDKQLASSLNKRA